MAPIALRRNRRSKGRLGLLLVIGIPILLLVIALVYQSGNGHELEREIAPKELPEQQFHRRPIPIAVEEAGREDNHNIKNQCPYSTFDDLTDEELHPQEGSRHMVNPPKDSTVHLVCCSTTKGPWNLVVHPSWAPLGAQRALDMIQHDQYMTDIPLFRCISNFLCQFGLSSQVELKKEFSTRIADDPNWLPSGPTHRQNPKGVKRFAAGYLAYAGSGPNSRSNQWIVALQANGPLAGGSPWEVPWGELVGKHSFETLSKIYTGYGENGPPQGKLMRLGMTDEMRKDFSSLDYIQSCHVVDTREM